MKEKCVIYNIEILTDCFCKIGDGKPEIRGTSIRGMIREWTRLLGGNPDNVWGGKGGNAGKVGIAISNVNSEKSDSFLMPHKGGNKPSAIEAGATFELVLSRLVGCTDQMWYEAKKNVENWLLLGCLGQRANRAAGSVWNSDWNYKSKKDFLAKSPTNCVLLSNEGFDDPEKVRTIASDTVAGHPEIFGDIKRKDDYGSKRISSPIKMKVIKIDGKFHLLLFAKQMDILTKAVKLVKYDRPDNENWSKVSFE